MKKRMKTDQYMKRLEVFLGQLEIVGQDTRKKDLYEIMDTVPFRDLETALMMATTYPDECRS